MSPSLGVGNKPASHADPYQRLAGFAALLVPAHDPGSLQERLTEALGHLCEAFGALGAWVALEEQGKEGEGFPHEGRHRPVLAASGFSPQYLERINALRPGEPPCSCGHGLGSRRGARHAASIMLCRCPKDTARSQAGDWYYLAAPIESDNTRWGHLSLAFSSRPVLDAERRAMLRMAAGLVGESLARTGMAVSSVDSSSPGKGPFPESSFQDRHLGDDNQRLREALEALTHQYELILESAGEGICGLDRTGRITFVNPAAARMLGYRPEEIVGVAKHELFHHSKDDGSPLSREECVICSALIHGSRIHCGEDVFWCKDGSSLPVEYTCAPIYDGRQLKGGVLIFRDVSQRRELERQRRQLQSLVEEAPAFLSLADPDGNILYYNKKARQLLGIPDDAPIEGYRVSPLALPYLRMAAEKGMWQGERTDFAAEVLPGGKGLSVYQTIVAHRNPAGEVDFYSTFVWDLSEQRRLEQERERLLAIIEDTPDFVATSDPEGRVLYYNKAARRMLGLDPQEDITGVCIQDTHPECIARMVMQEALPAAARDGTWQGETVLLGKDGRRIPVSQVIIAHKDARGKVRYFSTIARDITERKQMEARLEYLASHDFLTGILNRARFQEELERELARARRYGTSGTLIFLDLDNFKDINDTLGHQAGDQVLRRLAQVLRSRLRATDVLARLGGDEFVVLLPHTSLNDARTVGEAILERMRQEVTEVDGKLLRLRASLGIVAYPDQGDRVEDLLIAADMTMYEAKRSGGHRISVASGVEQGRRQREFRLCWERRITEALSHDGFVLYRQPVVSLDDGRVTGYELLLRMKDGPDELVLPHEFLPVAERTGLMLEIDRWVLQRAVRILAHSPEEDGALFVNLSGMAFSDDDFFTLIQEQLRCAGANAGRLVIELTETGVIRNFSHAGKFIEALRKTTGCRFALDDFGKGFSSLWALRDLDVDFLKIDGAFVRELLRNSVDQHIVRAIVSMAKGLGKRTIAEFIPNEATLDVLREWGVDWGQGYHVGRPEPVPDFGAA